MSYIANVHAALNTAARNVNVLKNAEASVLWVVVVFTVTCPTTTGYRPLFCCLFSVLPDFVIVFCGDIMNLIIVQV